MDHLSYSSPSQSSPPPPPPTDDAIEAIIQHATSARPPPDRPLRDTRTQLFVGNLPYRVRWQDLKDLFRKAGTVLRADVSLGPDNRSRGYGTVLLATAEDAGRAVDMFNGYSWQTRVLEVRLDRLLPEYEAQSVPGSASSSAHSVLPPSHHPAPFDDRDLTSQYLSTPDPNSCRNLFVGNLPFHCQWQDLKDLFRQAGTILRADVALGPDGRSRGFGTVTFATEYDAERALRMFNGYEYNNRTLKVHYDKHPSGGSATTSSTSPATVGANTPAQVHSHPTQISLPPGFMFDYGPPSAPASPYDMFTQIQMQQMQWQQQQQQNPQIHHDQLYQKFTRPLSQPQPNLGQKSSPLDIDSLTISLAHTRISRPSPTPSSAVHKPPSISAHTSSSSTTGSSSEPSIASTSASSVAESPRQVSAFSQQQQQKPPQVHPHHPGPISLPPLVPTFPISPHTPLAQQQGMSFSPLHHPAMGSPFPIYQSGHPALYQQHAQVSVLTPHGLPPITPSMPPFTFLPPSFVQQQQGVQPQRQRRHQHNPSSASSDTSGGTASASASSSAPASESISASAAAPPPASSSSSSSQQRQQQNQGYVPQHHHQQQQQQQQQHQYPLPSPHFMIPLPSPGLYIPHPQPSPPVHMRLNLSGIPSVFSPGVAMSPGTFYGRPGEVPNPNPFINAAVGAPVHVHSPPVGGLHQHQQQQQQHPQQYPQQQQQGQQHVTHGAYFYAMSSPKNGPPSGMEPKGYFDPMYFPPGASVGVGVGGAGGGGNGGSGLVNEIMRDVSEDGEKEVGKSGEGREQGEGQGGEGKALGREEDEKSPASASVAASNSGGTGTVASGGSSGTSLTSWYTNEVAPAAVQSEGDSVDLGILSLKEDSGATISRTHSVGHVRKHHGAPSSSSSSSGATSTGSAVSVAGGGERATMARGNSDPVRGVMLRAEDLKLPLRVPEHRRVSPVGSGGGGGVSVSAAGGGGEAEGVPGEETQ